MRLPLFTLHQPQSTGEAVSLAAKWTGQFDFLAGGTDLLPNYKQRLNPQAHVISLAHLPELKRISVGAETKIGALVTLETLAAHTGLRTQFPALAHAAGTVASPLIRRQATLGGNVLLDTRCFYFNQSEFHRTALGYCLKADGSVCHVVPQKERCYATYSGDTVPVLTVLGAQLEFASEKGTRVVACADFFVDEGRERFKKQLGELLTAVVIPSSSQGLKSAYEKLRLRESFDFPEIGVAVALRLKQGVVDELRVCASGVSSAPVLYSELTQGFVGKRWSPEVIEAVAAGIQKQSKPVKTTQMNPAYRKKMLSVFTRRALEKL